MKIAVFDTYVTTHDGARLHFDVLVPEVKTLYAEIFARQWLADIGLPDDVVDLESCRYCHSETPGPEILQEIRDQGCYILQMEGCPSPR
ncbi:MAG TPA: DUF2024 family protein [Gammaproteobacteria bacterium]